MSQLKVLFGVLFGLSLAVTGCGGGSDSLDNPKDAASRPSEEQFQKMHAEALKEDAPPQQNQKAGGP